MPDFCTCGAQLPPDSLFCHKCGKPQREVIEPEPQPESVAEFVPPAAPPIGTAPQPPALNFHNLVASSAAAPFPLAVKTLLQQGLRLRDRHQAGSLSAHGLAVATGRLEAQLDRMLDRHFRR